MLMDVAVTIIVAHVAAISYFAVLPLPSVARSLAWLVCSVTIALSPCLIPVTSSVPRMAAALVAIALLAKLYDVFRTADLHRQRGLRSYLAWLPNWFWLVARKAPPSRPRRRDWESLPRAIALTAGSLTILVLVFARDWATRPFALEHGVKVAVTYYAVVSLAGLGAIAYRMLGGVALDPMSSPAAAPTPAEFWRRWNRPAQQFLQEYAFRPAGGLHRPIRAILATFAVSAVLHEYLFGIATGRIQGWQALFFLSQGVAATLTFRLRPTGWGRPFGTCLTLIFNLAASLLFFKSVNAVLPFYSPRPE